MTILHCFSTRQLLLCLQSLLTGGEKLVFPLGFCLELEIQQQHGFLAIRDFSPLP